MKILFTWFSQNHLSVGYVAVVAYPLDQHVREILFQGQRMAEAVSWLEMIAAHVSLNFLKPLIMEP